MFVTSACRAGPATAGCTSYLPCRSAWPLPASSRNILGPLHLVKSAITLPLGIGHRQQQHQRRWQQQRVCRRLCAMAASQPDNSVLFVCLGNICRSPSAEAVFKSVVERAGQSGQYRIDSCGTGGGSRNWYLPGGFSYHEGDPADERMTAAARSRGITLSSRSRPLTPQDLAEFDYIIGMDDSNLASIRRAAEYWRSNGHAEVVPEGYERKLSLMTDYLSDKKFSGYKEVPDPYYGGQRGFELVLDLLEDACRGLATTVQQRQSQ